MLHPSKIFRWKTIFSAVTLLIAVTGIASTAQAASPELDRGYRNMYNLDFNAAHGDFRTFMTAHPEDPLGPVSDAAAFLFTEFDRLGILDIELFADDDRLDNRARPAPNPQLRTTFNDRTQQADRLADAILKSTPNDAQALFAKTMVAGLRSDYAAFIDKSDFAALKFSKIGTALGARTLQADPQLYDAHLAGGIENYMLSLKPAPIRFFARMTGASTDKAKGIREVSITAEHGHYLAPFARLMLAVAELRDGNKERAKSLLSGLAQEFPRNTLYQRQLLRIH
ncbi:MAG: hypothetical protein JWM43_2228 [Acidobacteriaceae bacterium]|nr:hypothetical protein [Acidobacteriaceae bacterium]